MSSLMPDHRSTRKMRCGMYKLGRKIGKGNFAVVRLAKHDISKTRVAIKIVDKSRVDADNLEKVYREIQVLKSLKHKHIVKLYEVMETERKLFIVTEYAGGGELFNHLLQRGRVMEPEARVIFRQIISAVLYCHSSGVVHRDLKAENLLFDSHKNIKLVDFGFSNFWRADELLSTWCGSPPYAAPELFLGQDYDGTKADIWSLGVVLYILVSGGFPFPGASMDKLKQAVLSGRVDIPWMVSVECADLIRKMLVVNPTKRISINQLLQHRWFCCLDDWTPEIVALLESSARPAPLQIDPLQHSVLVHMQQKMEVTQDKITEALIEQRFDPIYATYHLLCDKLKRMREGQETRSALTVPPTNQPRRGSRGSITTGLANVEVAGPTISANDLALLDMSSPDELSSDSSGSDDDVTCMHSTPYARRRLNPAHYNTTTQREKAEPTSHETYERFLASSGDARRHTLCAPSDGSPLFNPPNVAFLPILTPQGGTPVLPAVPFPLEGAMGQIPNLAQFPNHHPSTGFHPHNPEHSIMPHFFHPQQIANFEGWNRRASLGGAHLGGTQLSLPHPASFAGLPTAQIEESLSGEALTPDDEDNQSADEAGARYLQAHGNIKRHTLHDISSAIGRPMSPVGPMRQAGGRDNTHFQRVAISRRRASDSSQLKPHTLANLERLHAQALIAQAQESNQANSVMHLQRELQHLTASDQQSMHQQPGLHMIAEHQEHASFPIWSHDQHQPPIGFGQPVLEDFQKEAERIIQGQYVDESHTNYFYNEQLPQMENEECMDMGDEPDHFHQKNFFSSRTLSMLFNDVKQVLDAMKVRYEQDQGINNYHQNNRRLSLEDEGGTRIELLLDAGDEKDYRSALQLRRIAGDAEQYDRLCIQLFSKLKDTHLSHSIQHC